MSFYFDEDNHGDASAGGDADAAGDDFVCFNCGGEEFYVDGTTGEACCAQCFTQSQTTLRASQEELDMDEVMEMVARTKGGHIVNAAGKKQTGPRQPTNKFGRKPLDHRNQSAHLPDLLLCLEGFQRILKESCTIVCDLAGTDDYEAVFGTIKTMWSAYLKAWSDGADHYGALYPNVRFAMRDSFLGTQFYSHIVTTLSYHMTKLAREERVQTEDGVNGNIDSHEDDGDNGQVDKCQHQEIESHEFDVFLDDYPDVISGPYAWQNEEDDDDCSACSDLTTDDDAILGTRRRLHAKGHQGRSMMLKMLAGHFEGRRSVLKRKEAALLLKPSMTMVAAMLWIAVSPLGVSDCHILEWISNGALPLINAFRLLPEDEKRKLQPIANFFRIRSALPTVDQFQRVAMALQVATGYRPPRLKLNSKRHRRSGPQKKKAKKQQPTLRKFNKPTRMLTPASVPMMTARFVSDLQFGQQVLDFSLALMGLPSVPNQIGTNRNDDNDSNEEQDTWLPPALKAARPDKLVEPTHILGVIVVACKLVPGWESGSYVRPIDLSQPSISPAATSHGGNNNRGADSRDTRRRVDGGEPEAKRRKIIVQAHHRFVPWNEDHFRLLGNGKTMEGYLEFLEEQMIEYTDVLLPEFVASLDLSDDHRPRSSSPSSASSHQPESDEEEQRVNACPLLVSTTATSPRSINILQRQTAKQQQQSQHRYELIKKPNAATLAPCPPHLGLLIEYMAYKAGVEASEIEKFCFKLDDEIATRFGSNDKVVVMPPFQVLLCLTD